MSAAASMKVRRSEKAIEFISSAMPSPLGKANRAAHGPVSARIRNGPILEFLIGLFKRHNVLAPSELQISDYKRDQNCLRGIICNPERKRLMRRLVAAVHHHCVEIRRRHCAILRRIARAFYDSLLEKAY